MNNIKIFRFAQKLVVFLPEPLGRGIFNCLGSLTSFAAPKGVRQLRKNQARIVKSMSSRQARKLSAKAMRSYMRYYYEALRLSAMTPEEIISRVRVVNSENLKSFLNEGKSVTGALLHAGNWDLAGAWAELELSHVETMAEKLDPPELYEFFVDVRSSIGMTIYPTGGGALQHLRSAMEKSLCFTPILADRDLSASGVEVTFFDKQMLVAAGPALLAQRTGCPIFPVFSHYHKLGRKERRRRGHSWEMVLTIGTPVCAATTETSQAEERREDIARMSQEWLTQFEPWLREHPEDWHMLQKVFVDDLDPERLARTRERARAAVEHKGATTEECADKAEHDANVERPSFQENEKNPRENS